jgi:5-formyltetrahydrofolate cyclo-ligase
LNIVFENALSIEKYIFIIHLGKGKDYGDIEYAMMRQLGACDDTTLVVTSVHGSQLLNDLTASVMTEHDLYVN